jgi:FlaG/FlaF family flagellin (archaellin)
LNTNKAISDFMATLILIAVTVAIVAGFLTWLLTTYYTLSKPEVLRILQETRIYYNQEESKWVLKLHVRNVGDTTGEIYRVGIVGWEEIGVSITVNPGQEIIQEIELSKNYTTGTWYLVKTIPKIRNHVPSTTTANTRVNNVRK